MLPAQRQITTIAETGLPWSLIREIAIRRIDDAPGLSATETLGAGGATPALAEEICGRLMAEGILTTAAPACLDHTHYLVQNTLSRPGYAGVLPVPLKDWRAQAAADDIVEQSAPSERIREIFSDMRGLDDMVDTLCDHIGLLEHCLIVGPEGAGYPMIARRLARLHDSPVSMPAAVLVGDRILILHDPEIHGAPLQVCQDPRYMRIPRPCVIAPDLQSINMDIRTRSGYAVAPLGVQATGGVLLVSIRGKVDPDLLARLDRIGLSGSGLQRATIDGAPLDLPAHYCLTCEGSMADAGVLGGYRMAFGLRLDVAHPGEFEASLDFIAQMRSQGIPVDKAAVTAFLTGARREKLAEIPRETVSRIVHRVARLSQGIPKGHRSSGDLVARAWTNEASLRAFSEPAN